MEFILFVFMDCNLFPGDWNVSPRKINSEMNLNMVKHRIWKRHKLKWIFYGI